MDIDYVHSENRHTVLGAKAALPYILGDRKPKSFLDVGCGLGTWVHAAIEYPIIDVCGIDGVEIDDERLLFPRELFRQQDLSKPWDLGRRFDIAICLEVAEHLPPVSAELLVRSLTKHSDAVVFSAACPGQGGQHHVNCQWPQYWQSLFNRAGYTCDDSIKWQIWNIYEIEPWYRQNIFLATREPDRAGGEPRIHSVVHPDMVAALDIENEWKRRLKQIEMGNKPVNWYFTTALRACAAKFKRKAESIICGGKSAQD